MAITEFLLLGIGGMWNCRHRATKPDGAWRREAHHTASRSA